MKKALGWVLPVGATLAMTAPFFLWLAGIALVMLPRTSFDFPAQVYAGKTVLCAGALWACKPWRFVSCKGGVQALLEGGLFGFLVYVLWVLPEVLPWDGATAFYRRWLILMPGTDPNPSASWCYAWSSSPVLATLKLLGSAFVIAPIEEFFFRGWLMRWLTQRDWQAVPLQGVSKHAFWMVVLLFALEHDRVIGGLLAGIVYGALAVRTGSLRASIVAHCVTNFILGLHVLALDAYTFW